MAYLYLSAAHKSSGKTSVSLALTRALRDRGHVVQPFKKGPDYIDPLWLTQAAGRACYNLDFYTMPDDEIQSVFAQQMQGADIGVIEGNKGLFDGMALDGVDSNAGMAKLLNAPVVLVLDTQGTTRGVAPLVMGYQAFDVEVNIAGIILNKVAGPRHEGKLREVLEHYTDLPVLGAIQRHADMHISERHLGLVPSNEAAESDAKIDLMAARLSDQVDLEHLLKVAQSAPAVAEVESQQHQVQASVRIGVAQDEAFGFYYPGDLQALEQSGAEIVPFSPVNDTELPAVDGLFIGGGFPETHLEKLSNNAAMCDQIRAFVEADKPVYAECGGLMYLCRQLTWGENTGKMANVLPADVTMHETPQGRGYIRLAETDAHPWPSGQELVGHEFHYSALSNLADDVTFAYDVRRGFGVDGQHDGVRYRNLLANYAHMRDTQRNRWAERFVAFIKQHKHD